MKFYNAIEAEEKKKINMIDKKQKIDIKHQMKINQLSNQCSIKDYGHAHIYITITYSFTSWIDEILLYDRGRSRKKKMMHMIDKKKKIDIKYRMKKNSVIKSM